MDKGRKTGLIEEDPIHRAGDGGNRESCKNRKPKMSYGKSKAGSKTGGYLC